MVGLKSPFEGHPYRSPGKTCTCQWSPCEACRLSAGMAHDVQRVREDVERLRHELARERIKERGAHALRSHLVPALFLGVTLGYLLHAGLARWLF